MAAGARTAGDSLDDANAGALQLLNFIGIIGKQPDRSNAKRFERFGSEFIVASIVGKTEMTIGLDSIQTGILKFVRFQFINEPNSAAFLRQVQKHAGRLLGDFAQRKFQLRPAIAALGRKNIAGKALGMDAN